MNKETVIIQVNRLFDNYNQQATKSMRDAKVALLFPKLQQYHSDSLVKAVDRILDDDTICFFPTFSQIKSYLRAANSNSSKKSLIACDKCDRSGYYTLWQLKDGNYYPFAYRCDCPLGQSYIAMPLIDPTAIPKKVHSSYPPSL